MAREYGKNREIRCNLPYLGEPFTHAKPRNKGESSEEEEPVEVAIARLGLAKKKSASVEKEADKENVHPTPFLAFLQKQHAVEGGRENFHDEREPSRFGDSDVSSSGPENLDLDKSFCEKQPTLGDRIPQQQQPDTKETSTPGMNWPPRSQSLRRNPDQKAYPSLFGSKLSSRSQSFHRKPSVDQDEEPRPPQEPRGRPSFRPRVVTNAPSRAPLQSASSRGPGVRAKPGLAVRPKPSRVKTSRNDGEHVSSALPSSTRDYSSRPPLEFTRKPVRAVECVVQKVPADWSHPCYKFSEKRPTVNPQESLPVKPSSVQPPLEQLPSMQPPLEELPSMQPPLEQLPSMQPPLEELPSVQPPLEQLPSMQPPLEQQPSMQPPLEQQPSMQPPLEQQPSMQPPLEELPSVQPPLEQQPSVQPPLEQLPSMQPPLEQQPSVQPPLEQQPSVQPPLEQQPSMQPPLEQQPSGQPPLEQQPSVQPPLEQQPSMQPLLEQQPSMQPPLEQQPSMQPPLEQQPLVPLWAQQPSMQPPLEQQPLVPLWAQPSSAQQLVLPRPLAQQPFAQPLSTQYISNSDWIQIHNEYQEAQIFLKLSLIGRGGFSEVYKVQSMLDKQLYALKTTKLPTINGVSTPDAQTINEIHNLTKLKGKPGIIQLIMYCWNESDRTISFLLELGSVDLSAVIQNLRNEQQCFSRITSRKLWLEMLMAVEVIHDHGIVHRDLKPANFLMVGSTIKLIDFGTSLELHEEHTSILTPDVIGTVSYMAPETLQAKSEKSKMVKLGRYCDVWSMGCILYQMAYGYTPFDHVSRAEKSAAICDPNYPINYPYHPDLHAVSAMKLCLVRDRTARGTIQDQLSHPFLNL